MILQLLIDFMYGLFMAIINLIDLTALNDVTRNIPKLAIPDMFRYIAYFLDKSTVILLIKAEVAWINFKIIWAVLLRIKSFIPTISST